MEIIFIGKVHGRNKFGARRTWSELCGRWFASKAEARRGEQLALLEKAGDISHLAYQPSWMLSERPKVRYTADFSYEDALTGVTIVEDVKGKDTEASRVRRAWLKQRYGIEVVVRKAGEFAL